MEEPEGAHKKRCMCLLDAGTIARVNVCKQGSSCPSNQGRGKRYGTGLANSNPSRNDSGNLTREAAWAARDGLKVRFALIFLRSEGDVRHLWPHIIALTLTS